MVALLWVNPTQRPSENFSDGLNFESSHFYRLEKVFEGTGQFRTYLSFRRLNCAQFLFQSTNLFILQELAQREEYVKINFELAANYVCHDYSEAVNGININTCWCTLNGYVLTSNYEHSSRTNMLPQFAFLWKGCKCQCFHLFLLVAATFCSRLNIGLSRLLIENVIFHFLNSVTEAV